MHRQIIITTVLCLFISTLHAQTPFFKTDIGIDSSHLDPFYSSLSLTDEMLFFVGNDYTARAYNRASGKKVWELYTGYKYAHPSFVLEDNLFIELNDFTLILHPATGEVSDTLPVQSMFRKPVLRNGVLYGTGITSMGVVFAYDLKKKGFLWQRFIGHGFEMQTYYEDDRIVVNAEGSSTWAQLSYDNGRSLAGTDTATSMEEYMDPSCLKEAEFRTHDRRDVSLKTATKLFKGNYAGVKDVLHTPQQTVVLEQGGNHILVLNNRLKPASLLSLQEVTGEEDTYYEFDKILKVVKTHIWVRADDQIIVVDLDKKSAVRKIDLSKWAPAAMAVDGNELWLVSKNDGQLYGLRL